MATWDNYVSSTASQNTSRGGQVDISSTQEPHAWAIQRLRSHLARTNDPYLIAIGQLDLIVMDDPNLHT